MQEISGVHIHTAYGHGCVNMSAFWRSKFIPFNATHTFTHIHIHATLQAELLRTSLHLVDEHVPWHPIGRLVGTLHQHLLLAVIYTGAFAKSLLADRVKRCTSTRALLARLCVLELHNVLDQKTSGCLGILLTRFRSLLDRLLHLEQLATFGRVRIVLATRLGIGTLVHASHRH